MSQIVYRSFIGITTVLSLLFTGGCIQRSTSFAPPGELVIFPAPPDTPRIQFLMSISSSDDIRKDRSSFRRFVFGESEVIPLLKPYGIAASMNRLYVCDQGSSAIAILDLRLREMQMFAPKGYGQLQLPLNCCVDDKGWLYVADAGRKQVVIFDNALQYIAALGEGEGFKPNDVVVENGRIWVADAKGNRICVYDQSTRELLYCFPQANKGDPGFVYIPTNIVVTGERLFVSDMGDFGVKEYTHKGEFLGKLGSHGNRPGQFARPKGIAIDKEGNLFVADAGFENVQVFNRDKTLLMYFGGPYQGPGDMYLPAKVCVDYRNLDYFRDLVDPRFDLRYLIYVTNQYGPDKIGVYGFVELRK